MNAKFIYLTVAVAYKKNPDVTNFFACNFQLMIDVFPCRKMMNDKKNE